MADYTSSKTGAQIDTILDGTFASDVTIDGITFGSGTGGVNSNTVSGLEALESNTTGSFNVAIGRQTLRDNTNGQQNTASGNGCLRLNTTGDYNTASGANALNNNTTGTNNTATGKGALLNNTTGNFNTSVGNHALRINTTGSGNTAISPYNSSGGYAPVYDPITYNDRFCMGSTGVTNAYINVAWTVVSDARDKTDFAPVPYGLDFVNQLQPTAYKFKQSRGVDVPVGIVRYGFKAQDILALEGDTPVIVDNEDLDKLRFNSDSLIPVLVNAIQELSAKVAELEAKLAV